MLKLPIGPNSNNHAHHNNNHSLVRGAPVSADAELGEIEAVLKRHEAVRDRVVVMSEESSESHKRLVAYVVGSGVSLQELRQHAQKVLPGYMLPSALVFLQELPLPANGKVNRRALPEPVALHDEKGSVPPRDALETQLVAIWEKALRIEPIGVTDDFFELGGHSLLAARIFSEIKRMLGKNLPLAMLFQTPTVEKLAAALREQGLQPMRSPLVAIQPHGTRPAFFAVHAASVK